jgi:hypothetical protein
MSDFAFKLSTARQSCRFHKSTCGFLFRCLCKQSTTLICSQRLRNFAHENLIIFENRVLRAVDDGVDLRATDGILDRTLVNYKRTGVIKASNVRSQIWASKRQ